MGNPVLYVVQDEDGQLRSHVSRGGAYGAAAWPASVGPEEFQADLANPRWDGVGLIREYMHLDSGVLMDCVTKTFAWHTLWDEVGRARLEHAELARAFPGWNLRWAVEGAWSFADVLGISRSAVVQEQYDPQLLALELQTADDAFSDDGACILTVREAGETRSFPLVDYVDHAITIGADAALAARWTDDEFGVDEVMSGVCVDVERRTVQWWTSTAAEKLYRAAVTLWPGWSFECMGDDFEVHNRFAGRQIARIDGELEVPDGVSLADPVLVVRPAGLPGFR
ncbi:hypothetical protein [Tsukamurella hominis]|uniref:hypothetical protein n=1 Tax=Tsukamurella hominis TaxID=1970232 RepID=UPI0039E76EA8